jgi:RNA polymerase sigma factor (sigma-70 family)
MAATLIANTAALQFHGAPPGARESQAAAPQDAEARLAERARERRPSAWAQIYDAHYSRLYTYCFARIGDRAAAAHVASQAFLQAVGEVDRRTRADRPLFSWLFNIARSRVNEYLERADGAPAIERRDLTEADRGLLIAMRALTSDQQDIVALHYYAGCGVAETAAAMERSETFVVRERANALRRLFQACHDTTSEPSATAALLLTNERTVTA